MSTKDWEDKMLYDAFYEDGNLNISVFGAAASGGLYLLYENNPYLIKMNLRELDKPAINLKTGFYHGKSLFDRDPEYTAIAGSFKRGLHIYLGKVCKVGNQSLLPSELKDYLLANIHTISNATP